MNGITNELLDTDLLFQTLLLEDLPDDYTIASELDADSIDRTPFLTHSSSTDGQVENGPGLWTVDLTVNLYGVGKDEVAAACKVIYGRIHAWATFGNGSVTGVGTIVTVEDTSSFSSSPASSMIGDQIRQSVGSWSLLIRN